MSSQPRGETGAFLFLAAWRSRDKVREAKPIRTHSSLLVTKAAASSAASECWYRRGRTTSVSAAACSRPRQSRTGYWRGEHGLLLLLPLAKSQCEYETVQSFSRRLQSKGRRAFTAFLGFRHHAFGLVVNLAVHFSAPAAREEGILCRATR